MRFTSRLLRLPLFPIWLVAAALFGPMPVQGKALFWGTPLLQFVPWWSWAWETLLAGHLPLWNPQVGMGAPLLANYQTALFYPPTWPYLALHLLGGAPWLAWGQALLVALHLAWAGAGMVALARRLGLGVLAQSLGGLSFGFCSYLVARAGFLSINAAAAWLPWVLWCLTPRSLGERISLWRYLVLVLCLALQLLAGHAQTTWYTLILAGLWSGFWAWESGRLDPAARRGAGELVRAWGWLLAAVLFALALSAIQILPTAEYLAQSQRAQAVDYELAMSYSFWPWRLLDLFAPGFFGHPAHGDYWGYGNYWEDAIYIGLLPMLLALGVVLRGLRRSGMDHYYDKRAAAAPLLPASRLPLIRFCFALFLLALLLGLGKHTPVFPWLYDHIPGFGLFQAPTRIMIWAEFSLALLAALGADAWRRPEGRGLYWTRLGTAGAFAVTLGAGAAWIMMGDISPSFLRATALAGLWGLLAGVLSLLAPPRQQEQSQQGSAEPQAANASPSGLWQWGVVLVVAVDLFVAGWGSNPAVDMELYGESLTASTLREMAGGQRLYLPVAHEEYLKFERFLRFDTFNPGEDWRHLRAIMLPNTNMLDGVRSANNFDPLLPGRYARWIGYLDWSSLALKPKLLGLMDVGLIERVAVGQPYGVRFERFQGGRRARWAPCVSLVLDAEAAWEQVMSNAVDFQSSVVLEADGLEDFADDPTVTQAGDGCTAQGVPSPDLRVNERGPNHLEIRLDAPQAGWLVLSDAWYPGWRAWVDGQPAPIYPANYLFRAVRVEPGEQRVEFRYQPCSFWLGSAISLLAWCACALLWRKRRKLDER